jgi:hypothetical protein
MDIAHLVGGHRNERHKGEVTREESGPPSPPGSRQKGL